MNTPYSIYDPSDNNHTVSATDIYFFTARHEYSLVYVIIDSRNWQNLKLQVAGGERNI